MEQIDKNTVAVSAGTLIKSTLFAIIFALIILVLFILPAEYNIDPTGIGTKLGLTVLAQPVQVTTPMPVNKTDLGNDVRKDTVDVIVPANRGVEYKFQLSKGQTLKYQWQTDDGALYLDLHGEPEGDTTGYYESYTIATSVEMSGQFTTSFSGIHGWYWKNKTDKDVKVTLTTEGSYKVIGLKK